MRQASLPPELWLEIISFLAAKRFISGLCALSTQSRRFRALCLPHIFSDFAARVDYRSRHRDAEPGLRRCTLWDLETFLSSNTQIQASVRCLRISVWSEGEETWLHHQRYWNPELVLRILKSLPSLKELHIRDLAIGATDMAAPALRKFGAVDLQRLHIQLSRNMAPHDYYALRFRGSRALPLRYLYGLMSVFSDVESVFLEDLEGVNVTATPDISAALVWPSNLKTRSLTASGNTPWAMIVKGMLASPSAHLLTSLDVGDDPSFRVSGVMAVAIRALGPNLTHLGIWPEALQNGLTLHGLVEDWDKIVFAHCRNLRSLALYLSIASQISLRDPNYSMSRGPHNMWYRMRRVLKHMLIGTAIAGRSSSAGLGDEESGVSGGGGGGRKDGARGDQDGAGDDESGDDDNQSPPTTFVPGTLRSITLKLTAHCTSNVCTCTDDALRAHFAMQHKMFAWVETPLLRFLELPHFEYVGLELLPNSNIAWGREKVPQYLAHLLLPPCFPRLDAMGKLWVKEFARWV